MSKLKEKISAKNIIFILSICLYSLSMLIFEIAFCNGNLVKKFLGYEESIQYNFSFTRVFIYIILMVIFIKYIKRNMDNCINSIKSKYKIALLIFLYLIFIIVLPYSIYKHIGYYRLVLLVLDLIMGTLVILHMSNDLIKNIIITSLTLGILFSCTTQFNGSLDEKRHFMSAYNISIGNLNYKNNNISEESIEQIPRVCKMEDSMKFFGMKYENKKFENNGTDFDSLPSSYNFITYLPSAIGIFFARITGGSLADIYITGRLFNLLAYTLLIIYILKILPFKKDVFFITYMLPMLMLLSCSYSIDGIVAGFVGLFTAYCLKLYHTADNITTKQIVILAILFAFAMLAKELSYIAICFLLLLLPIIKIIKKNPKAIIFSSLGVIGVALIILKLSVFSSGSALISDPRNADTNLNEQIKFLLNNPLTDVKIIFNHIEVSLLSADWLSYITPKAFLGHASRLFLIQLGFMFYVAISDNSYKFKIKEKIIILLTFMFVFGTGSLLLYLTFTAVGSIGIAGYQTRYLFPILPLIFMIISNNNNQTDSNYRAKISSIANILMIVSLIGSIYII